MKEALYICYRKDEDGSVTIDGYAYGEEWVSQALLMGDWKYPTEEEARDAWRRYKERDSTLHPE